MRYCFEARGSSADDVFRDAQRRVERFAGERRWSIESIEVDKRIMTYGGEVLQEIASVEAWIEDDA